MNACVEKCTEIYSTRSASHHCCNTSAFAFTRVPKFIGALTVHPAVSITTAAAEKCKKLFEVNNESRSPGGLELVLFFGLMSILMQKSCLMVRETGDS